MKALRHLLSAFSFAIGLWVVASVAGVLFDPLRIQFWTSSLMWALLASLMVAPALVVMTDDTIAEAAPDGDASAASPRGSGADAKASPPPPVEEQPSFVDDAQATYPVAPEPEREAAAGDTPEWVRSQGT